MSGITVTKFCVYLRDALSGLGILYVLHLTGAANMTVESMTISPAQASAVQNSLDYSTEALPAPTMKRRAK